LDTQPDIAHPAFADDTPRLWAKATAWRGAFNRALRRLERAQSLLEESLPRLERLSSVSQQVWQESAFALWQLGCTLYDLGNYEKARRRYEDSLATYRALGDRWGMASVSHHLGDLICMSGAPHEAEPLVREGLAIQRALGDHRGMAGSLRVLGVIAVSTGRLEESVRLARESVDLFREMGDRGHAAEALLNLGYNLGFLGRLEEAHRRLSQSVAIYRDLGFGGSWSSLSLSFLARIDMLLGQYEEADALAQEALVLAQEEGHLTGIGAALWVLSRLAIPAGEYAEALQIIQPFLPETGWTPGVGDFAIISSLTYAAHGLDRPDRVRRPLCEGLRLWHRNGDLAIILLLLPAIALLLADEGQVERAVELYALASRYPYVANARWFEDAAGKHISAAAAKALPPDVVAAAQERGRARDLQTTIEDLLAELENG
jgi:tetratricopeptide (TPR) repeat protein